MDGMFEMVCLGWWSVWGRDGEGVERWRGRGEDGESDVRMCN